MDFLCTYYVFVCVYHIYVLCRNRDRPEDLICIVVGNKSDCYDSRQVSIDEGPPSFPSSTLYLSYRSSDLSCLMIRQ